MTGGLNMGSQDITSTGKILYSNLYSAEGDLPSASTYHGMFAHVHGTGAGYFAHAGSWIKLANQSNVDTKLPLAGGTLTGAGTTALTITNSSGNGGYFNVKSNVGGVATDGNVGLHIGWNKSNGGREINMIFDGGTSQADTEMIFTSTDGTTYTDIFQINGAVGTGVDIKSGGLRIGTTPVIDASRNITGVIVKGTDKVAAGNLTAAPVATLDVGSTVLGLPATSGSSFNGLARIGYNDRSWTGSEMIFGIINAGAQAYAGYLQMKQPQDQSVERPLLLNPQGGPVGIATDTPIASFQVGLTSDSAATAGSLVHLASSTASATVNGFAHLKLDCTTGHAPGDIGAQIMFNQGYHGSNQDYTQAVGAIRGRKTGPTNNYGGGLQFMYQPDSGALGILEGMTMTGEGKVGIGTTSPAQLLEVSGNAGKSRFTRSGSAGTVMEFYAGGSPSGGIQVQSTGLGIGGTNGENQLFIKAGGNVGIGTTSPAAALHLKSTTNSVGPSLIFENTNNAQTMNIDYYNNGGAVQSRIQYAEGPAAWYFQPNMSTQNSTLTIHYNGSVDAGGLPSGTVRTHGVVVSDAHKNDTLGSSIGDTQRVFGIHNKSHNQDYLTFRTRRITDAQTGWNHAVWDITRDIDNTSDLYHYITFGIGDVVINDSSANMDFRVESNTDANMLFVDGGNNRVGIGTNAPQNKFDVNGSATIRDALFLGTDSSDPGELYIADNSSTAYTLGIIGTGTRTFEFRGSSSGADYNSYFTNPSSGRHNLHINGYVSI